MSPESLNLILYLVYQTGTRVNRLSGAGLHCQPAGGCLTGSRNDSLDK